MQKPFNLLLFVYFLLSSLHSNSQINIQNQDTFIWYDKPAKAWTEAIPIGNSYMGGMIYGGTEKEQIQLNESTLYTGEPNLTYSKIDVRKHYKKVAELIKAKQFQEAQAIISKEWLGRNHQLYQPMGDLWLDFGHSTEKLKNYKRSLDLTTAISTISYEYNDTQFKREYFASYPDHCIVIRLSAKGREKLNFKAYFSSLHKQTTTFSADKNSVTMKGRVAKYGVRRTLEFIEKLGDQHKYPELFDKDGNRKPEATQLIYDQNGGMAFESQVKIRAKDAKISYLKDTLQVSNASEVILILGTATSFNGFDKNPATEGINPSVKLNQIYKSIENQTYENLLATHLKDYKRLFDRVQISIENKTEQSALPTDKRVELFANGKDQSFAALYFQFGRYLMIAGSRIGGQPLNLQGIWNDQLIPPWNGGYTININAQMNYWPAEITNLSECQEPFFEAIKELAQNGQKTAREMYGNNGWVAHHNTDIWRNAEPIDNCNCSFWNVAGGWLVSHFWEKYLFTGDKDFLKNEVFPLLKGSVEFYEDWLIPNENGFLVTPVGMSPELNFIYETNKQATFSSGPTMDMAIIRETYERYIEACKLLNINDSFTQKAKKSLAKLLPYQIGKHGQLQEWQEDFDEAEKEHRHISHLYPIYPSNQFNHSTTPELIAATEKVMERRGDAATGWSMGWKVNIWARLLDGDHALKLISNLFKLIKFEGEHMSGGGTYPNLFDAHPPFQIDGNFGATAGIAEMLVQSHAGEIYLLPALPKAWSSGKIKGLKARGGFIVDMEWKDGKILQAQIKSNLGGNCRIRTNQKIIVKNSQTEEANGEKPNPLFSFINPPKPIIKDASKLLEIKNSESFIVDFETQKGVSYQILVK